MDREILVLRYFEQLSTSEARPGTPASKGQQLAKRYIAALKRLKQAN